MKYRNPRSLPSVPPPDYRERLHRLADFVDGIRPDDFTLDDWISRDGRRGCALGLAASQCEALKAQGLRLGQDDLPVYLGTGGLDAITGFFGITRRDAKRVFGLSGYPGYPSPRRTAAELRALASRQQCAPAKGEMPAECADASVLVSPFGRHIDFCEGERE